MKEIKNNSSSILKWEASYVMKETLALKKTLFALFLSGKAIFLLQHLFFNAVELKLIISCLITPFEQRPI